MVDASSQLISTGCPGFPLTKFALFDTIVVTTPSNFDWLRYAFIQAPDRLPGRAYGSKYHSPTCFPAGSVTDLPGPNVSYKREVLETACGDLLDELRAWENVLHGRLLSRGMDLWIDPGIVVYHAKVFGFWDFLTQRYYFGRSFAATRVATAPLGTRAFWVAISLLLPPLFLWRYARYFIGKRRFVREVIKTSPLLVLFAVAWSVGEFFGYAFGDGGASLRVK